VLTLDEKELASCVSCGLCLPHCPTFRVSGEEGLSPRGRIDAMRSVQWRGAPVDDSVVRYVETCVQCRGCEPVCPSGVPFGHLMEQTKAALASAHRVTPRWQRAAFRVLGHHRALLAGSTVLAAAQRVRLVPRRFGLGRLPLRRGPVPSPIRSVADPDVWLFTGCVMDAWLRATHRNTGTLIEAAGASFAVPGAGAACCGALHVHAGLESEAKRLATRTMAAMPGEAPIVVNSAGCGAAMKDFGRLIGTVEAEAFSARVRDVHEWLAERLDDLPAPVGPGRRSVIVQDPCHLRHVQKAHQHVRTVLERYVDIVELDDEGLCCGAGGAYSALQPELASEIRDRKLAAVGRARERSGASVVASANPGCAMHLAGHLGATGVDVRHPVDIIVEAAGVVG
jgi:glycolate oxidase iron-sulfur subunit